MKTGQWLAVVVVAFVAGATMSRMMETPRADAVPAEASLYKEQRQRIHEAVSLIGEIWEEAEGDCDRERVGELAQKSAQILTLSPENSVRSHFE